jgi:hypothetical protein
VESTKSINGARPHPNPVAGTPSARKSPHPDRSDPDRNPPGDNRFESSEGHQIVRALFIGTEPLICFRRYRWLAFESLSALAAS